MKAKQKTRISLIITVIILSALMINKKTLAADVVAASEQNKKIERPSQEYPLGVASDATLFAGNNMIMNIDYSMQGQFYAGHFVGGTGLTAADEDDNRWGNSINDFSSWTAEQLPNRLDPAFVSASAPSKGIIRALTGTKSLLGPNNTIFHYVLGTSSEQTVTDQMIQAAGVDTVLFKSRAYQLNGKNAYLGDIDYFKNNHVSNQEQAISNVTNVSDYYANLTATEYDENGQIIGYKDAAFNDAIQSVSVNDQEITHDKKSTIQINIDMDKSSTTTGVVAVNIDGAKSDGLFQKAKAISINLLNYTAGQQKIPYIVLNYHNFSGFNFENGSSFTVTGYTPAQVTQDQPDANQYYPTKLTTRGENLTPASDNNKRYNTASHILNNFNTINGGEDSKIQLNSNTGGAEGQSFIGTILAPHTNIEIDGDGDHSFAGNVITNRNLYVGRQVTADKAFGASFNADGDFPGTSTIEPVATVPKILSVTLPDGVNFSPENIDTHYVFQFSLNNNTVIDPESETMHRLDGRKIKNTFLIDQPANTTNILWTRMNDGSWKKYLPDGNNPLAANDTSKAQTTELSIDDVTEELKTADGKDNYDDQTQYAGDKINGIYSIDGVDKAFIGQHVLHKNKFSFVVASDEDDLATMSEAQIKSKYDNTIVNYTLEVHGDILVNYPTVFDFGSYQLGTSSKQPTAVATGQIYVENPFYLNWQLTVDNITTGDHLINNPLLQPNATAFWYLMYTLKPNSDDTWTANHESQLGNLSVGSQSRFLELNTQGISNPAIAWTEIQPTKEMQFYKSKVRLKFNTVFADETAKRTGVFNLDAQWNLTVNDKLQDQ